MKKNIFTIVVLAIVIVLLGYVCYGYFKTFTKEVKNPIVTMEIEGYGTVKMELYPEYAPNTVKNFINLIQKGYYNGKVFSGLDTNCLYIGKTAEDEIENAKMSMVKSDVEAGSEADVDYSIEGEFVANGFNDNTLKHEKGILSMCRLDYTQFSSSLSKQSYNSANAQFSILINDERALNGLYAGFGRVIEGMDIIENISKLDAKVKKDEDKTASTDENAEESDKTDETEEDENALKTFVNMPVITSMTVDTFGVNYGEPKVQEAFDYYNYMYNYYSNYYGTQN